MIRIDLSFAINVGSGELGTVGETTSAFYGILFSFGRSVWTRPRGNN
jgi:hypothetical protein